MYWTLELASKLEDAPWPATKDELIDYAVRSGAPLEILRVCNDPAVVRGHQRQRTVFALPKLTIPDDKVLLLEIVEKNGARHQTVEIAAKELLDAKLL